MAGEPVRDRLGSVLIGPEATVRDAMIVIDSGAVEIALMVDESRRLLGTVSDGDIRRALIAGASLDDPVRSHMSVSPKVVGPTSGRAEVLDVMRAMAIGQVPVVADDGTLVGLHVMHELLGSVQRDNWAVIMAGGRGTRLAPLTDRVPKPMLPVAGRPILERLVLHLVGSGIRRIYLSVNYLGEVIEEHFGDGTEFGCEIRYLREEPERPLGTGGSLSMLRGDDAPTRPVLVLNGDLLTNLSVERLFASHESSGAQATVVVREYATQIPFGVAEFEDGRLLRFTEKPVASYWIGAGIYVVDPVLIDRIPQGRALPMPGVLEDCLDRGEVVNVWPSDDEWADIGRPVELQRAMGQL